MSSQNKRYFGGIEGGASHTQMILLDEDGNCLAENVGPSTNHWLVGLDVCLQRISDLVKGAKVKAGLDPTQPLASLGMSLSGGDSLDAQKKIKSGMLENYPEVSSEYLVTCDTVGSIATACENGGMVLISGTGSNCELMNPDGERTRCGGWGHMMGDEGGAYWISDYCIKCMYDKEDNLDPCCHDVEYVKQAMTQHFGTCDKMDMLEHIYTKFDKGFFAGLCKLLAEGAREQKDALCLEAFYRAGWLLARHIVALVPKIHTSLLQKPGGLRVVCVGSVWKSFDLLVKGFKEALLKDELVKEVTLLKLLKPSTYGAAFLGAKTASHRLPFDFSSHAEPFYHHVF